MNSEIDVPEPEDSGSDGRQEKSEHKSEVVDLQPVGRPMERAITGLAASNSRAFGGEVASTLIAGATSQMAVELDQIRKELHGQREKNERVMADLSEEKIKSAVLSERVDSFRSTRHLKNIGIAVGTLSLSVGLQLIDSNLSAYGVAALVIGSVLLLVSWMAAPKGDDK